VQSDIYFLGWSTWSLFPFITPHLLLSLAAFTSNADGSLWVEVLPVDFLPVDFLGRPLDLTTRGYISNGRPTARDIVPRVGLIKCQHS
jgi:hypothetical protein